MRKKIAHIIIIIFVLLGIGPVYGSEFDKALNVPLDKVWTIKFNKNIDPTSVTSDTIYILSEDGVKFNIQYSFEGQENINQVKLLHKKLFEPETKYKIYIRNIKGINGEKLAREYTKEFITESLNPVIKKIDLDDPEVKQNYEAEVFGTFIHPFSYDYNSKEYYTYILRGVTSGADREGYLKPYPIPEDTVFAKTLNVYYSMKPRDYFDGKQITIRDLELYQQTIMEFTKEKPYWVERVSFKKPPKNHDILFYIIDDFEENVDVSKFDIQKFHFKNAGLNNFYVFLSERKNTHIPMNNIFNKELVELKEYRKIYANHQIYYDQVTGFGDWTTPMQIVEKDQEHIYYNLVNTGDLNKDGGYIYNRKNGKSKKIADGWLYAVDEKHIYYTNEHIIRLDKDGSNKKILYCKSESPDLENFTTLYLHDDYIYSHNRFSPGEIWRIKTDGTNPELIIKSWELQDEFAVSEDGVFYTLDDGIYQASLDGSYIRKILDGNYTILYWEGGYLYYKNASDFYDYDEYKIKTSNLN